jgi:hypothetical protein
MFLAHWQWRITNQPSNSTSCSDSALRLWVLVAHKFYWGLQVTTSFLIWGCVLKGYFKRAIFGRAKLHLKGIENFNLEQWTPPTLIVMGLMQYPIDHETLSTWCHVQYHVGFHLFWNFFGPSGPFGQVWIELGPFPTSQPITFVSRGQGPSGFSIKWPSIYSSHCHHVCVGQRLGRAALVSRGRKAIPIYICEGGIAPPRGKSWTPGYATPILYAGGIVLKTA